MLPEAFRLLSRLLNANVGREVSWKRIRSTFIFCIIASIVTDLRGSKLQAGRAFQGWAKDLHLLAVSNRFRTTLTMAKSFDGTPVQNTACSPLLRKAYSE